MVKSEDFGRNLTRQKKVFNQVCQHVYPILIDHQLLHPIAQSDQPSEFVTQDVHIRNVINM